jgi:predicted esterase
MDGKVASIIGRRPLWRAKNADRRRRTISRMPFPCPAGPGPETWLEPCARRACAAALYLLIATASLAPLLALAQEAPATPVGLQRAVTFTEYSPLSANLEIVRRLYSPLVAAEIRKSAARAPKPLPEQSVDLAQERFAVYVPARRPPDGYSLLVFVPPWQEAGLPRVWAEVLDRYGVIFVSAARSGNDEHVFRRRAPLALLAAHNILQRYGVNRDHVYISGFSGGSRVALRLALGYPDLFRGALLNAGSDPLDLGPLIIPPKELFARFQETTRIVYVTGERDAENLSLDGGSRQSMRHWCVFNVDTELVPRVGHSLATAAALSDALRLLLGPPTTTAGRLPACRAEIAHGLDAQLDKVQSLTAAGERSAARKLLLDIDRRFGGLAAPRSLELRAALD